MPCLLVSWVEGDALHLFIIVAKIAFQADGFLRMKDEPRLSRQFAPCRYYSTPTVFQQQFHKIAVHGGLHESPKQLFRQE